MKPAIMSILDQFRSPKSVIDKRRDKYLDVQRNNRRNSEPNPASEDYSKLSSILLTELPVFLNSVAKAFDTITYAFAQDQALLYSRIAMILQKFDLEQYGSKARSAGGIVKQWWADHQDMSAVIGSLACAGGVSPFAIIRIQTNDGYQGRPAPRSPVTTQSERRASNTSIVNGSTRRASAITINTRRPSGSPAAASAYLSTFAGTKPLLDSTSNEIRRSSQSSNADSPDPSWLGRRRSSALAASPLPVVYSSPFSSPTAATVEESSAANRDSVASEASLGPSFTFSSTAASSTGSISSVNLSSPSGGSGSDRVPALFSALALRDVEAQVDSSTGPSPILRVQEGDKLSVLADHTSEASNEEMKGWMLCRTDADEKGYVRAADIAKC